MNKEKAASLLGLAMKAGQVVSGEFYAEKTIRSGKAHLVILSEDASENTRKKFTNMAVWYKVPVTEFLPKADLGRRIGKGERSVAAVTDKNLAEAIKKQLGIQTEA